jgi:hypothetical protein
MARQRRVRKQRQCWTMVRYALKNGSVCHVVESDSGARHNVWQHPNGTQACDCSSYGDCCHKMHVREKEQSRKQEHVAIISTVEVMEQAQEAMEQFERDCDPHAYEVLAVTKKGGQPDTCHYCGHICKGGICGKCAA